MLVAPLPFVVPEVADDHKSTLLEIETMNKEKDSRMSKSGKWSAVNQVDSNSFANCPYQVSTDFSQETDYNPQAFRSKDHYDWVGIGIVDKEENKLESFFREAVKVTADLDTDTIDDFYVDKEVILGAVVDRRGSGSYSGWSIVVRTVIRWEENSILKTQIKSYDRKEYLNRKPDDIKRWETKNGKLLQPRRKQLHTKRGSRTIRTKK